MAKAGQARVEGTAPQGAASACQIEITPAMIEAGLDAFDGYEENYEALSERFRAVFCAMMRAGLEQEVSNTPDSSSAL